MSQLLHADHSHDLDSLVCNAKINRVRSVDASTISLPNMIDGRVLDRVLSDGIETVEEPGIIIVRFDLAETLKTKSVNPAQIGFGRLG